MTRAQRWANVCSHKIVSYEISPRLYRYSRPSFFWDGFLYIRNMQIHKNYILDHMNTFGVHAVADTYIVLESPDDIPDAIVASTAAGSNSGKPTHILGGWSNILITAPSLSIVRHPTRDDLTIVQQDAHSIQIRIGAGMMRDALVRKTISQGRRWIENLIAIPGTVGAAPIQNIGAYGIEFVENCISCEVYDFIEKKYTTLVVDVCEFGYRTSIFKHHPGRYLICFVTLRLQKNPHPRLTYSVVPETLQAQGITDPTQEDIAKTIESIRRSKLPRPEHLGNIGSFFQNPHVDTSLVQRLLTHYPSMPHFPIDQHTCKVPAAWLIEHAELKWFRRDQIGTFPLQPLVIVNYGGATGAEIREFSETIIHYVHKKFGITLVPEVNIWS